MTETAGGSDVGRTETARAAGQRRPVAAVRPQVVQLRGGGRSRAGAGATRGRRERYRCAGAVLRRDHGWRRHAGRELLHRPAQGQARHARTADRGNPPRGPAGLAGGRAATTACGRSRRCSTSPAPGTPSARWPAWRVPSRWRATTRARRAGVRPSADRAAAARADPGRHAGRVRGRLRADVRGGPVARPGRARQHRSRRTPRCCAC